MPTPTLLLRVTSFSWRWGLLAMQYRRLHYTACRRHIEYGQARRGDAPRAGRDESARPDFGLPGFFGIRLRHFRGRLPAYMLIFWSRRRRRFSDSTSPLSIHETAGRHISYARVFLSSIYMPLPLHEAWCCTRMGHSCRQRRCCRWLADVSGARTPYAGRNTAAETTASGAQCRCFTIVQALLLVLDIVIAAAEYKIAHFYWLLASPGAAQNYCQH